MTMDVSAMQDQHGWMIPTRSFLRLCRRTMWRPKVADSLGLELTGAGLLTGAIAFRRLLLREVLAPSEKNVGLLLPPSVPTVLANAALLLARRVAVNLNYTVSSEILNLCIARAGIRRILTSRRAMERFEHLKPEAELVYLEDLKGKIAWTDKVAAALQAWLLPVSILERRFGLTAIDPDELMTLIFTSGSTGDPKGVMLTYRNVGSNVEAFNRALHLKPTDTLLGVLPFFHSFGYTVALWAGMMLPPKLVYHTSPLDARQIGEISRKHRVTLLIVAPTFLRSYLRRVAAEDFASLELVVTGAEKLPRDLADAFEKKFNVRPVEGYGTTELSPVVSANIPPGRAPGHAAQSKEGTVGRPISGVQVKVVHLETGEDLPPGKSGMLLVKGPNVMKGYLDEPEKTAEVIRDGWYVTGDVAQIDEEGYIRITGRESRFSKIGGEMVPHLRIEEALGKLLALDEDKVSLAVTGVADQRKGERLVVLHTGLPKPPDQICRELAGMGLPPLFIPSPDSFHQIPEIPLLGTGKLDLRKLKALAEAQALSG
jgi:acyl-[acyl-carrier-protein]-phospholipid O-acyltransferase/long-chain-fatty-acid--[acyl-carrier-protein] ligase